MSTQCTQCGTEIAGTSKFCPSCGAARPADSVGSTTVLPSATPAQSAPPAAPAQAPQPQAAQPQATPPQATPPQAQPQAAHPQGQPYQQPWQQQQQQRSGGFTATVFGSLTWPTVLVFAAAGLAFELPAMVYAFADFGGDGAKATLALLLALTIASAVVGTIGAWTRVKHAAEERSAAWVVFGFGVFASVLSTLTFLAVLGQ